MTAQEARENAIENVLDKMIDNHQEQYATIQSRISKQSDAGHFSAYIEGGIHPDVSDLLQAEGYSVTPKIGGFIVRWLT